MEDIYAAARALAENLKSDIQLSKTREEHIRVTARANAAAELAALLETAYPQIFTQTDPSGEQLLEKS